MRTTVYAELAAGAKGMVFRATDAYRPQIRQISRELDAIFPFLAICEPADFVTACLSEGVTRKTLLCGDRGILLIVLRKDLDSRQLLQSLSITLSPPKWLELRNLVEIGGGRSEGPLAHSNGQIQLAIDALDCVGVYLMRSQTSDTRPVP